MSRYDHKIESCLEGIEHLSKEKKEPPERKMKEKNHYYLRDRKPIKHLGPPELHSLHLFLLQDPVHKVIN